MGIPKTCEHLFSRLHNIQLRIGVKYGVAIFVRKVVVMTTDSQASTRLADVASDEPSGHALGFAKDWLKQLTKNQYSVPIVQEFDDRSSKNDV